MHDSLVERNIHSHKHNIDARFPMPIIVKFQPTKSIKYSSRFRFVCEYGNNFDILLEGEGTYEEHEHRPLYPNPR